MAGSDDFEEALAEALDVIDRVLAEEDVPLVRRPLKAAREFVRFCILQVRTEAGPEPTQPGGFLDYMDSEWFKVVYARTVAWYRSRYGEIMVGGSGRTVDACTMVLGTAFRMTVPLVTSRPATPGKTVWLHWPERVADDEDALAWIDRPPNFSAMPRGDGLKARRLANAIAGRLRSIHCGMTTVEAADPRVGELSDPIISHLGQAAAQIAEGGPIETRRAQWELRMACELSLKMLSQQRGGSFTETHDLYVLHDRLPAGKAPFDRTLLTRIPKWEAMAEWRYGGGPVVTVADAFSRYRATLQLVDGATEAAERKYCFHGANLEIRKAPYLHDDETTFQPRHTE
ncbi:hypothetical protein [Sphingomonas carotinifaciens]|uniref:Uncharacterized protein n=1 Tax=Sphingomonas carotinifaciens TaxID=1166323 RepID=A0A1G7NEQ8_9SPHN|nr:hypothetical protein [Sphingomonas carotinifaciens]MBB4087108.1 hypothetical protein [Sphingomonas carotinifaciens]MWC43205.1 hypothetical protein [Sphingomonas carotinifaciens]SDF72446.1 hypothetical protein SAMN05216557_105137 [Sphingomonas carotinifaciens]